MYNILFSTTTSIANILSQQNLFENNDSILTLAPILFIPTLFSLIEQDLAQKFFAAKNQITATISAFLASLFIIIFSLIPLYFGILARIQHINIPHGANPLITILLEQLPHSLFLLVVCGIIAAITSTANSLLCAISSNIIQDFNQYLTFTNKKLLITRIISCIIGISALTTSFFVTGDIIKILEESYRISVVCLFIPTIAAYFYKPNNSLPAWLSSFGGLIGYIFIHIKPIIPQLSVLMKDIIPLLLSSFGYIIAHQIKYKKK